MKKIKISLIFFIYFIALASARGFLGVYSVAGRKKFRFLKPLLVSFIFFFGLAITSPAYGATEFISTIRSSGGDYTTLSGWESANQTDLTASTTKVFSHGGITGAIADTDTVTGKNSGATASVVHTTTDQILLETISGTFQSGEQIYVTLDTIYVTISDAGDSAIAVAECYNDWPSGLDDSVNIDGWTTGVNNYVKIYTPESERHNGKIFNGTDYTGFALKSTQVGNVIDLSANYSRIDGLIIDAAHVDVEDGISEEGALLDHFISNNILYRSVGNNDNGIYTYSTSSINRTIVWNNIVICGDSNTWSSGINTNHGDIQNNTVYNCTNGITQSIDYPNKLNNNISVDNSSADYLLSAGSWQVDSSNNISSDTTAPEANSQTSVALADLDFVSTTLGSEDFHIGADSVALNAGVDLSSTFTDDIDGQTRDMDGEGFDIGADEGQQDFISKIRVNTESDWDFDKLSTWEDAIESDLTATTSKIYTVSDTGTFDDTTDQEQAVTFTGGGTGTLLDINSSGVAYITGVSGTVQAGIVTVDTNSHTFTISDTGAKVGRAVAECYNDWPSGLEDNFWISGWTTSATNYVKVYTLASERHDGWTWTDDTQTVYSGFAVVNNSIYCTIRASNYYTQIEGVIVNQNNKGGGTYSGLRLGDYVKADSIIAFNSPKAGVMTVPGTWTNPLYLSNILVYDNNYGIYNGYGVRLYNVTAVNNTSYGIYKNNLLTTYLKNVLAYDNGIKDFYNSGSGDFDVLNCASSDDTADDFGGSGNRIDQEFSFVDEDNDDFHLALDDTGARNFGTDLSLDSTFPISTDIDGEVRDVDGEGWDIGADESGQDFVSKIRVNTESDWDFDKLSTWEDAIESDLTATTSKIYTVSDTGTYSDTTDQSQAVTFTGGGTGTLLDINSSGVAYITGVSGTVTAGTVTVTSSSHTFTISDTGAKVGRAVAECYNDWPSGLDDRVDINGWITGVNNYVKVTSPSSERHTGVAGTGFIIKNDTNSYVVGLYNYYSVVEWLEVTGVGADTTYHNGVGMSRYSTARNLIVHDIVTNDGGDLVTGISMGSNGGSYIYNNIIYNIKNYSATVTKNPNGIKYIGTSPFIYNNTVYGIDAPNNPGKGTGIFAGLGFVKNNIVINSGYVDFNIMESANHTNNISSDDTALGSNSQTSVALADLDFVSTTAGTEDLHIGEDSVARNVGTDLSSVFTLDIDGYERGVGLTSWDIGADEVNEYTTTIKGGVNIKGGVKITN